MFFVSLPSASPPVTDAGPNPVPLLDINIGFDITRILRLHTVCVLKVGIVQSARVKGKEGHMKPKVIRNFVTV